jgi:hypothetical protein
MPQIVYIVRSLLYRLAPALFAGDDSTLVLSLEDPHLPGRVVHTTPDFHLAEGETLSYDQVLNIILGSRKVMAL